jgi:hypothetical protein
MARTGRVKLAVAFSVEANIMTTALDVIAILFLVSVAIAILLR